MAQSTMQAALLAARFRAEDALAGNHTPTAAAAAARAAHTMFDRAWANERADVEAEGAIACKAGCNWCCHQHVAILGAEALAVQEFIAGTALEERLRTHLPALLGLDAEARRAARTPCPFLEASGCAIYEVRPNRCRAVYSRAAGKPGRRRRLCRRRRPLCGSPACAAWGESLNCRIWTRFQIPHRWSMPPR